MVYEEYESDYNEFKEEVDVLYEKMDEEKEKYYDRLREIAEKQLVLHNMMMILEEEKIVIGDELYIIDKAFMDKIKSLENNFNNEHDDEYLSVSVGDLKKALSDSLNYDVQVSAYFERDISVCGIFDSVDEIASNYIKEFNSSHRYHYMLSVPGFWLNIDFDMGNSGFFTKNLVSLISVQNDGKTLLEHCSSNIEYDEKVRDNVSRLIIDKDMDEIMISFSYKDLASNFEDRSKFICSIDENILKEAFFNCLNKKSYVKK